MLRKGRRRRREEEGGGGAAQQIWKKRRALLFRQKTFRLTLSLSVCALLETGAPELLYARAVRAIRKLSAKVFTFFFFGGGGRRERLFDFL